MNMKIYSIFFQYKELIIVMLRNLLAIFLIITCATTYAAEQQSISPFQFYMKLEKGDQEFSDMTITGDIDLKEKNIKELSFRNVAIQGYIQITKTRVSGSIALLGSSAKALYVSNSAIEGDVLVDMSSISGNIQISDGTARRISISKTVIGGIIHLKNMQLKSDVSIVLVQAVRGYIGYIEILETTTKMLFVQYSMARNVTIKKSRIYKDASIWGNYSYITIDETEVGRDISISPAFRTLSIGRMFTADRIIISGSDSKSKVILGSFIDVAIGTLKAKEILLNGDFQLTIGPVSTGKLVCPTEECAQQAYESGIPFLLK